MNKDNPIKVVYVHHCATYGGPCRSLGLILPNLIDKGIEPHIISPEGAAADYFRSFTSNVHIVKQRPLSVIQTIVGYSNTPFHFFRALFFGQFTAEIKRTIKKINPNIVHCNELGLLNVAKISTELNIPVIMHARTMQHKDYPQLNKYVINKLKKYANHVICISGSLANFLTDLPQKSIIYNPVEKIPEITKKNKTITDDVIFLSLAAFRKSKGVYEMIEAAEKLIADPRIKIKIAGKVNNYDPSKLRLKQKLLAAFGILDFKEAQHFQNLIKSKNLKNIELLGHVDDIDTVLKTSDVMLAPMRLNSPPRSVCEAGLYEMPSILSMEDKIEDVIENGVNGILINEQAPEELVDAMLMLANDPELRSTLGANARNRFIKVNNPEYISQQIYTLYKTVIK